MTKLTLFPVFDTVFDCFDTVETPHSHQGLFGKTVTFRQNSDISGKSMKNSEFSHFCQIKPVGMGRILSISLYFSVFLCLEVPFSLGAFSHFTSKSGNLLKSEINPEMSQTAYGERGQNREKSSEK